MHNTSHFQSILGAGNALMDIMIALPDNETINQFRLARGGMTLVDGIKSWNIYQATRDWQKSVTTGGSAANTIHCLASLGHKSGYAGKIGDDELGEIFSREMEEKGIRLHLSCSESGTGRVMALITPDSERTMATYLGAAAELHPSEFSDDVLQLYDTLYVEGYLVQDHNLIETLFINGKKNGLKIVIDLASYNVVSQNRYFLHHLVANYVDVVFANEEEAKAFTGFQPEKALRELGKYCDIAVVKTGKTGSLVHWKNQVIPIAPVKANAIDTTGAGDSYAAGFLHGLKLGLSPEKCGNIASLLSARTVEFIGAKIPETEWPDILTKVQAISEDKSL